MTAPTIPLALAAACGGHPPVPQETAMQALQSVYDHLDRRGYRHDRELLSLLHRLERRIEEIEQ